MRGLPSMFQQIATIIHERRVRRVRRVRQGRWAGKKKEMGNVTSQGQIQR
jgi:hypothetical protein